MIKNLDPQIVWKNFYELTRIPRPSKHEEMAVEYMYNWGLSHGLETIKDEVGNIIIRKPATPFMFSQPGVAGLRMMIFPTSSLIVSSP